MAKDWMMKQWIMDKLGIKNPAKEFKSQSEEWAKIGASISEGLAEGLNQGQEHRPMILKIADKHQVDPDEILRASDRMVTVLGTDQMGAVEMIRTGLEQGVDKPDMSMMSTGENIRDNHTIIDPLIESFTDAVWGQQEKVLQSGKYEHPIHKDNHTALEWMDHQMSEFADALVYRECLKQTIDDVIDAIEKARKMKDADLRDRYLAFALDRLRKG